MSIISTYFNNKHGMIPNAEQKKLAVEITRWFGIGQLMVEIGTGTNRCYDHTTSGNGRYTKNSRLMDIPRFFGGKHHPK